MEYERVYLEEKNVVGLKIRTGNADPEMTSRIGEVWQQFYESGLEGAITNRKNDCCIGLYTNYENGVCGEYDVMVACEVTDTKNIQEGSETGIIEAGEYAKFVLRGDVKNAVMEFWTALWEMDLDRKFACDFEEYQGGGEMTNAQIDVYISLNE